MNEDSTTSRAGAYSLREAHGGRVFENGLEKEGDAPRMRPLQVAIPRKDPVAVANLLLRKNLVILPACRHLEPSRLAEEAP